MSVRLPQRALTLEDIAAAVCGYFDVAADDLRGRSQRRSMTHPRRVFCVIARERTRFSVDEIGAFINRTRWNVWKTNERVYLETQMNRELRHDLEAVRRLVDERQAVAA